MKPIFFCLTLFCLLLGGCSPQPQSLNDLKEWDLVFISDSTGFGVAELYAKYIEQDRGVKVRVHDASTGGLSAVRVVNALRGSEESHMMLAKLSTLIPQAEVIVLFVNPVANNKHSSLECVDGAPLTKACTAECYTRYRTDLNTLIGELFKLRAGAPTIVRTYELWLRPAWWKEDNSLTECTQCIGWFNSALAEVASGFSIPQAHITDVFNGPGHDEDPGDKGFIGADGIHASNAGMQAIAQALRGLGYEPAKP